MDLYLIIGLLLVILLLFIFISKNIKKRKLRLEQQLSNNFKKTGVTITNNDYLQQLPENLEAQDLLKVVDKIIAIPMDFYALGNKSKYQLVIDSGYIDVYEQVTNEIIAYVLTQQQHRINEWVQWSEDQRVSDGWFLREDNNVWKIGEFSTKDGYKETLIPYSNLTSACANFIKIQVEYTRQLIEADQKKKKTKSK